MIHVVLGTKAQLIKMAPVMRELARAGIEYNFIATGQHRDTMAGILEDFGIKEPDYVLYDGPDVTSIPRMAAWMLRCLVHAVRNRKKVFRGDRHGIVLVHGDTFSTLLGAFAGKLARLQVGHVESGLRSFNLFHPFPEEVTRLLTFRLSDVYFCPGEPEMANLKGYGGEKINTGANTLYDAVRLAVQLETPADLAIPTEPFAIASIHRFENIFRRDSLERVVAGVEMVAERIPLLFVLHKPTERKLRAFGLMQRLEQNPRIELRPRTEYFRFLKLLSAADFVVSDGGSNQEESYYIGKPILLFRVATERSEGLGENCVLSRFEPDVIADFLNEYPQRAHPFVELERTPSAAIVEYCRDYA